MMLNMNLNLYSCYSVVNSVFERQGDVVFLFLIYCLCIFREESFDWGFIIIVKIHGKTKKWQ